MSVSVKQPTVTNQTVTSTNDTPIIARELDATEQISIIGRCWLSRAFLLTPRLPSFIRESNVHLNIIKNIFEINTDEDDVAELAKVMRDINFKAEEEFNQLMASGPAFDKNLRFLGKHLGLNDAEQKLLLLITLVNEDGNFETIESCARSHSSRQTQDFLSNVIQCNATEFRNAFYSDSMLRLGGLLKRQEKMFSDLLEAYVVPLKTRRAIFQENPDLDDLISPLIQLAPPAKLTTAHYVGFEQSIKLVTYYLRQALKEQRRGANILLYGQPGNGKTEFARVMAKAADVVMLEVPSQSNSSQEPLSGPERIGLARQANLMYNHRPRILLFDEAEDVFSGSLLRSSFAKEHKAWINEVLETCRLPTIWISNNIGEMDPAVLRRFDVIIDFDELSQDSREYQFASVLPDISSTHLLRSLSAHKPVTVAMVERASSMAVLQTKACGTDFESTFISVLNNCLKAQNKDLLPFVRAAQLNFDPSFVHCKENLLTLAERIATVKSVRLCLFGPPGTGKSAFGRWLAERFKLPLVMKRGSDLLDKYVGQNERLIAQAFDEAKKDSAVLVIDEIDSFLSSRADQSNSWESRVVNELLTQLENFDGIFIATTNLMDQLDEAAMRRFDLKLHFDYLTPKQNELLLKHTCAELALKAPSKRDLTSVSALSHLTPGDFALLKRRHRLQPFAHAAALVSQLAVETQFKRDNRRIGF